ncbi:7-alpha-hydroxysteroid dehydrogenase [Exophiala viscosa]|uniref:7-alpha-hydroxysteroid dehydrogenase n=1 Tax=Exophiala viscosa TaxID=2486360 RepID=UPI002196C537|nr:7-alpha-hydroxysteroid dehydrogenase [Exophiala viscosa]
MAQLSTTSKTTQSKPKPWHYHITIDLLFLILANSIFHPWITMVFYLCLASVHKHREPLAYYTLCYTALLAVVEVCIWANHRITYGPHRKVDWENEVIVITGGGTGLGRVLSQMFLRKGAKVAVLDVREPDEEATEEMERWDLQWEVMDVSSKEQIEGAVGKVVDQFGSPTILINNAATNVRGLPLLATPTKPTTLSAEQASSTLTINALGHFNTLSVLLPYLITSKTGAHIVTVSSLLAHLAPASLSDYTASKAAVSSLHHTLCNELRSHPDPSVFAKVKTLLVEPGQLDTQLFADKTTVPFYAHFFGPVVEAKDIAKEIVRRIERGDGGSIRLPFYAKFMPYFGVMPGTVQLMFRWFSGIDGAMLPVDKKA